MVNLVCFNMFINHGESERFLAKKYVSQCLAGECIQMIIDSNGLKQSSIYPLVI